MTRKGLFQGAQRLFYQYVLGASPVDPTKEFVGPQYSLTPNTLSRVRM